MAWRGVGAHCLIAGGLIAGGALLSGCDRTPRQVPPRSSDAISVAPKASVIVVPVHADLDELAAALDRAVPRRLWSIDRPDQLCLPSRRVKVLFARIKTPAVRCRIVGLVTRGRLSVAGAGDSLVVTLPLHAQVSARDVGGVLKGETAQGDALVRARMRIDLAPDWSPRGRLDISYDWRDPPHVDFLGRRIDLTSRADEKLAGVVARLERTLPGELARLGVRDRVAQAWRAAFTALQLNAKNPPVWMRITPRTLRYGGYAIRGRTLTLRIGMEALTETFIGPRPADPSPTPLPPMQRVTQPTGKMRFAIPVIADYAELRPVLARALAKRSRRPFVLPGIGPVTARFSDVAIYGTSGGRIAVGLTLSAKTDGGTVSRGTIWLTARPVNAENSREVAFENLALSGVTDSTRTQLLIELANAPALSTTLAGALSQNFSNDYHKLRGKIDRAITEKREGDLLIRARIDTVRTGRILASGQGVFLPVDGSGTVSVLLDRD
jgi:hypothetical protein